MKPVGNDNRTADIDLLDDETLRKEIDTVKPLMQLQAKLYNKQMVRHEFVGGKRVQRAIYSNGTAVTIDLDKGIYTVKEGENAKA